MNNLSVTRCLPSEGYRTLFCRVDHRLLDVRVHRGFYSGHESRAAVYALNRNQVVYQSEEPRLLQ